jgi:hypothetical protein
MKSKLRPGRDKKWVIGGYIYSYRITYFVATLSYHNYYANLRDYSNSLLSGLP